MRRMMTSCVCLSLLVSTLCFAQSRRSHSASCMWFGQSAWVSFTDDIFVGKPQWATTELTDPPLSIALACRKAEAYVATTKADQLTYAMSSASIDRYFDTGNWYYRVRFDAVLSPGDQSWKTTEPYRTLLATGRYAGHTNSPPRLDVFLLLSGEVVAPQMED